MNIRPDYLAFGTPDFSEAEIAAVTRVLRSGWVGMGPETLAFEKELASRLGAAEVVALNSCTSALFLALKVEGVGAGDEVIVPSLTWCATANAALYLGAAPVFCDVDPDSFCATPESILARLTARTRAVLVVHYGGRAIDVAALRAALPPGVAIVEDAAHAMGASYPDGRPVGASGNPVCFSFYANKNLSTADGGAIALSDPEKAAHLRSLSMNGLDSTAWSRYVKPSVVPASGIAELGYKMNFTDLQAAIGRVQLRRLDVMADVRHRVALRYRDRLAANGLSIPFQAGAFEAGHARHLLVGRFDESFAGMPRDALLVALRACNIGASIHYLPLHVQPLYRRYDDVALPVTESLAGTIMTLPIGARMGDADVDYVVAALAEIAAGRGEGQ
jgi:dTDP-4-amino-4,6-dideoxygalactose transaminase